MELPDGVAVKLTGTLRQTLAPGLAVITTLNGKITAVIPVKSPNDVTPEADISFAITGP